MKLFFTILGASITFFAWYVTHIQTELSHSEKNMIVFQSFVAAGIVGVVIYFIPRLFKKRL